MKTYNILTFNEKLILSNQTQKEVDVFFIGKEKSLYLLEVELQEPGERYYKAVATYLERDSSDEEGY